MYPRRIGKGHARIAFVKACKIADPSVIVTAAKQYASIAPTSEMKFIPYPATWLNGERWEDDMTVINEQTNTNRLKNILNLDDIWDDTPSVEHQKVAQIDCKGR
ncbi:MAG: hypothetical protein CXT67_09700 [Methanobacteriota archaeon]|nr:MAG: hypothetical protein CXT67_09700 [Euryarchaeota archaeon]